MKKINVAKEKYLMFIDTETIGSITCPESVMPFEIGMKLYDNEAKKVIKEKSYLVKKFFNNKFIMLSCFSANKYPEYFEKLENDNRYKLYSVNEIAKDLEKIINKYSIKVMVAHNGNFDKTAMARLFDEFGTKNPLSKIDLLDTMEVAKVITYSKDYTTFCINNKNKLNSMKESNFITNSGRVRQTAQAIYSYLINDVDFKEAHTGLEDIDIEIQIYEQSINRLGNTLIKVNSSPNWTDFPKITE